MLFSLVPKRRKTIQTRSALVLLGLFAMACLYSIAGPWFNQSREIKSTQPYVKTFENYADKLGSHTTVLIQPPWRQDVVAALQEKLGPSSGVNVTTALALQHRSKPGHVILLKDPAVVLSHGLKQHLSRPLKTSKYGVEVGFMGKRKKTKRRKGSTRVFSKADVSIVFADGREVRCDYNESARRYTCPGQEEWLYVGPHKQTSGNETRQCIWSHPVTNGHIYIRWKDIDLPKRFQWSHAIANSGLRKSDGAPVTARLSVNQRPIETLTRTNQTGFATHTINLDQRINNAQFEIDITTPNDGARHYCWMIDFLEKDITR